MRFLFGVLLLPFVVLATSSAVIAETIGVNNLTQSSRDQLVRQAVSFFGGQSEWLRSNIRPPLDMNDFDRNRFMIELESSLTSTDMIWEPNSDVTLQVYFTGQLVSYDFDAGSYSV